MKKTHQSLVALLSIATALTSQAACKSHADIQDDGKGAYVIDSDNNIVRDSWGGCVRTIDWNKDIANATCEGTHKKEIVALDPAPVLETAPEAPTPVAVAPAPVAVAKPAPTPAPVELTANFRGLFETGSAILTNKDHAELDKYVTFMKAKPTQKIMITGHTDSVGSEKSNQKLSEARAATVKTYLEVNGISSSRMSTMGSGETAPIADNSTTEGRAENRRVVIDLVN